MPRRLYTYFVAYKETIGAPSFSKFARSEGLTLSDIENFKKHKEFLRAFEECREIRRDYLIDNALNKRFDGSVAKFLLACEFDMGEKNDDVSENGIDVTLQVIDKEKKNEA